MTRFVVLHQILPYITTIYLRNLKKAKLKRLTSPPPSYYIVDILYIELYCIHVPFLFRFTYRTNRNCIWEGSIKSYLHSDCTVILMVVSIFKA